MTNTLNGWPGIPNRSDPNLATGLILGTTKHVTLRRNALPIFQAFLADWHNHVHSIDYKGALGPDGWEYRDARTGAGLSCHAGGVAVDITYDWLKPTRLKYMSAGQTQAVHALLDKYSDSNGRRIFGWGGDWLSKNPNGSYRYMDEMHVELAQASAAKAQGRNTTQDDIDAVMARLGIDLSGRFTFPAVPVKVTYANIGMGKRGADVLTIQKALTNYVGLDYSTGPGIWGPRTQIAWLKAATKSRKTGRDLAIFLGSLNHFGVI